MYHDSPEAAGSASGQPESPWTSQPPQRAGGYPVPGSYPGAPGFPGQYAPGYGPAGYGGYGGPGGYGPVSGYGDTGSPQRPPKKHSMRLLAVTAVVALAVGAGATWGLTSATSSPDKLTVSQAVTKTDPGVVDVVSTLGYQDGTSSGTGIVLSSNGEILTNNHVIDGATSIKVRDVGNNRTYTASVVGYDETSDVAVLQLKNASGLTTATIGNSATVKVGDSVVAVGNAEGTDSTPAVATGKVTALNQTITASDEGSGVSEQLHGLIESNTGIEPGDSGGPLVNSYGQVVGMDTAASTGSSTESSTSASTAATQAYTIPINSALTIAREIESGTSSATVHIGTTAFLGVEVSSSSSSQQGSGSPFGGFGGSQGSTGGSGSTSTGAVVAGVTQGSPVASIGLAQGDTITKLAGTAITSSDSLRTVLAQYKPGAKVSISWTGTSGQSHTATITLASGPAA